VPATAVREAVVERVAHLGFEVRVELKDAATGAPFTAQITRGDANALGLTDSTVGEKVYARATELG
jgi:sulfate transport system ATP-binding protein